VALRVEVLVGEVVVLKDGQRFAAQPLTQTGPTQPAAMKLLAELAGHTNVVRAARFLPGNERLVSVDGNGNVVVWDAKTRRIVRRFKIAGETYSDADISADGRLLAVGRIGARRKGAWRFGTLKKEQCCTA
jgi:WD40 repeat protein